jgi:HD-GYP domain-containing protein (c-di-GMP phosphodiesterase class II)
VIKEPHVPLFYLVLCLSEAVDLIDPVLNGHHKRVAYIAYAIGLEMGLTSQEQDKLILAGLVHDCGALSLTERLDLLEFEHHRPNEHAELGYYLLKEFEPLSAEAQIVRYHHARWNQGQGSKSNGHEVPIGAHVVHLADRVAVLVNNQEEILGQAKRIREQIVGQSGRMFVPELVDIFSDLAAKEHFWLDATSSIIGSILARRTRLATVELSPAQLFSFAKLICQLIDFRSRFTATHSSGIAASASTLAKLVGFSERECHMMKVAGYFHDLGKLAVPTEILEKPGKLTEEEFSIIRSHTYHTYTILESIGDLDVINAWASFHHERLDGNGYPFHHKGGDLSLGSRIMAVADVLTAITEDRPYRQGMTHDEALNVLRRMAKDSALDSDIVSTLELHYDDVNSVRISKQAAAAKEYEEFGRV